MENKLEKEKMLLNDKNKENKRLIEEKKKKEEKDKPKKAKKLLKEKNNEEKIFNKSFHLWMTQYNYIFFVQIFKKNWK